MKSGSLRNCYRNDINDSAIETNNDGNKINNYKTIARKPFEYKIKVIGSTQNDNNTLNKEFVILLKCFSNF